MIAVCSYNVNSWQCTMFVNFFFFVFTVLFFFLSWEELCVVRLQWLRAQGHHSRGHVHEPPPKSTLGVGLSVEDGVVEKETLLKRCVVPELHPCQASPVWEAAASPGPPFSSPLAGEPGAPRKMWWKGRGWRIKMVGGWNWPNMTKGGVLVSLLACC